MSEDQGIDTSGVDTAGRTGVHRRARRARPWAPAAPHEPSRPPRSALHGRDGHTSCISGALGFVRDERAMRTEPSVAHGRPRSSTACSCTTAGIGSPASGARHRPPADARGRCRAPAPWRCRHPMHTGSPRPVRTRWILQADNLLAAVGRSCGTTCSARPGSRKLCLRTNLLAEDDVGGDAVRPSGFRSAGDREALSRAACEPPAPVDGARHGRAAAVPRGPERAPGAASTRASVRPRRPRTRPRASPAGRR